MNRLSIWTRGDRPLWSCLALTIAVAVFSTPARSQATVDASARRSRASDFTLVQLPALNPSLLQNTVSTTRPAPAKPAIEIQYDPAPDLVYPYDPDPIRWITVKNNGGYTELEFSVSVNGPNGFTLSGNTSGLATFPQPSYPYLQPNESQRAWILVNWSQLDQSQWKAGGVYDYRYDFTVSPKANPALGVQPGTQVVSLHNTVHVAYTGIPQLTSQPMGDNNAAIAGLVHDAATGAPIPNAEVRLVSSTQSTFSPQTGSSGQYSIPVTAYQGVPNGLWENYGVTIRAFGYADYHTAVAPHSGDTVWIDAPMTPAVPGPTYRVQSKFDGVLNQYAGQGSKDGKYFALVPFHSITPAGADAQSYDAQAQLLFFSTAGTLLWQFPLYTQTPAVAVSDDGSLVATARCDTSRSDAGVYLLNNAGTVVWFVSPVSVPSLRDDVGDVLYSIYDVQISHDNRYLAIGDTAGNLYLYDIAARKLVWQRFLNGQVRTLVFESDNGTLYASGGDGYLYSLHIDGTLNWRTYVGAWSTVFTVSRNYILVGVKVGYFFSLLDRLTGRTLWQYPGVQTGFNGAIAPDESYLMIQGTSAGFGTLLIDPSGVLLDHDDSTASGALSADGSYMLLTGQNIGSGDVGTTWLKVGGRDGRELWNSGSLDSTIHRGPLAGYAWISDDGKQIAAANGNWVYFLSQVPTPTLAASPSAISLSAVPGGACTSQVIALSSTSPAVGVAWSAVTSVSTAANWLSIGTASGSTPSSLSVTCSAAGLRVGAYSGSVQISAGSATALVSVTLTVGAQVDSVASAASGDPRLAPGQIVSVYGFGLATSTGSPGASATLFNGTAVAVTDSAGVSRPATLFYVSPGQINAMIPEGTALGAATLTVSGASGALGSAPIAVSAVAPALFPVGSGPTAPVAAYAFYYSFAGPITGQPSVFQRNAAGSCVTVPLDVSGGDQLILWMYGTGIHHGNAVTCRIGTTAATVLGAAMTQFPGEDQVNVLVPRSLAGSGNRQIVLTVDGIASNAPHIDFK